MPLIKTIGNKIFYIREKPVLLDSDLALWYQVETRVLKQTVRRNRARFPDDFMFELTTEEQAALRSQNVTLNKRGQHSKYRAFCFTEEGVAMLSGLLRSEKAIAVNIGIMRAFVAVRQYAQDVDALSTALKKLENSTNHRFAEVGKVLDALLKQKQQQEDFKQRKRIGFK